MTNFLLKNFTFFFLLSTASPYKEGLAFPKERSFAHTSTSSSLTGSIAKEKTAKGSTPLNKAIISIPATGKDQVGVIGVSEENPVDNPSDNLFHVKLSSALPGGERVYLVYELDGVEDHTALSRSINDGLSVGGYLIRKRKGWKKQREQIDARLLNKGDNVIRFTLPQGADYCYRVRNVSIEIETYSISVGNKELTRGNNSSTGQLIINQPSPFYYKGITPAGATTGKAYIKGFIEGKGTDGAMVLVEGKKARLYKGEFEALVEKTLENSPFNVMVEVHFASGEKLSKEVFFTSAQQAHYSYGLSTAALVKGVHYTQAVASAAKGASLSLKGARLEVSAGAVKQMASLSITALRDRDIPALDAGMVNVTKYHHGYRFLPHNTIFAKEVSIRMAYDESKIPDGYTAKDIRTYYFDENSHHWVALPQDTLQGESGELVSLTTHFTDMINAIIKVPESPEVNAYNSTSMKGIKAANPTAGVNLITPPSANNTGSASLGYSLHIPSGRKGMQPSLAVSYNSSGGNSWLGLGWNLSLPAVSIDTRWGVPRYDPVNETETYSLNGEQLSPVAHRTDPGARTANKRFYPRVEGAFSKITRHGGHPSRYFWEVIDKNGTKYYYGGTPSRGADENATLSDTRGNKAYWALTETIDTDGNFVRYHYAKVADPGLARGTVMGYNLYIDKITYTGHGGSEGRYSVHFNRDRELKQSLPRKDVTISANFGFKQVTADLLKRVDIKFDNTLIRSYGFEYKIGVFYKSLLSYIKEYDSEGKEFTSHTFDYYNEVGAGSAFRPFEEKETAWNVPEDNIKGTFTTSKDAFMGRASVLSGTRSEDFSAGTSVGVGFDTQLWLKTNSVGGNVHFSKSSSEGMTCLVDINGDNLPDKVFVDKDGLHFRPNISGPGGKAAFGDKKKVGIHATSTFHKEKSRTTAAGLEAQFGTGVSVSAGISAAKTTSTTTVYFTEANGDGLMDLVVDGRVYFNHINTATGIPTFTLRSEDTPSRIGMGSPVDAGIITADPAEMDSLEIQNPLHDMVRVWMAPYNGFIHITAPARLIKPSGDEKAENADGVRLSIQHKDTELWSKEIKAGDYSEHFPAGVKKIAVSKGDRVYFRLQSLSNGENDKVKWAPVITYMYEDVNLTDANNKAYYRFSSEEDFLLASPGEVAVPIKGQVAFSSPFKKGITSDNIRLEVVSRKENGIEKVELTKTYAWNQPAEEKLEVAFAVDSAQTVFFRIHTSTTIDYAALSWRPYLYYTSSDDYYRTPVKEDGKNLIEFYPVPAIRLYGIEHQAARGWTVPGEIDTLSVKPLITLKEEAVAAIPAEVIFTVKKNKQLMAKDTLQFIKGQRVKVKSFKIPAAGGDQLYFEYFSKDSHVLLLLAQANTEVVMGKETKTVESGFYLQSGFTNFGTGYRQWGHFAYNGNKERAKAPINQSLLQVDQKLEKAKEKEEDYKKIKEAKDLEGRSDIYNPAEAVFMVLIPDGKDWTWNGYDTDIYLGADVMSSARYGADDLSPVSFMENGGGSGAYAINKVSKGTNYSLSGGLSAELGGPIKAGASLGKSGGPTTVVTDFMDMNGDRYPDVVTPGKVQYSNAYGGLSPGVIGHRFEKNHQNMASSLGFSLSGSYVISRNQPKAVNIKKMDVYLGSGTTSAGLSGNYARGSNRTDFTWMDINGDGLPDRVYMEGSKGMVALNLGYSFAEAEEWNFASIGYGESDSYGGGLGFSIAGGSISGGASLSGSNSEMLNSMQDVNGDGLTDILYKDNGKYYIRINTGNSFELPVEWAGIESVSKSLSTSLGGNVAFTAGFLIVPGVKLWVNPSVSKGAGVSRELYRLTDVDGDGYPDFVHSEKSTEMGVKRSRIGRSNMLKEVKRPMGASFALDYQRTGNTYQMPSATWVLGSVKLYDGYRGDGMDTLMTSFAYEHGYYDRHEREFYGFGKVTTHSHDTGNKNKIYSTAIQVYGNDSYHRKGLPLGEILQDAEGKKYVEKKNRYELKQTGNAGSIFPALAETRENYFEGGPEAKKSTRALYSYNEYGNMVIYTDFGDEGAGDDLVATVSYYQLTEPYIMAMPKEISVTSNGKLLRRREASIDTKGNVTEVRQYLEDGKASVHSMSYNSYGNLSSVTRPANAKGERLRIQYEYDKEVATYVTKASNSYGYSSEASYDYLFGQVLHSKDLNGQQITYRLDKRGRVVRIIGPYEQKGGAGYTIAFSYHPQANVPYAVTKHYDPTSPKNDLITSTFADGLGRVLGVKKDVAIFAGENAPDKEVMSVSGKVLYDGLGRAVKAWYPTVDEKRDTATLSILADEVKPTETEYDVLGRAIRVTLPDGAVTKTVYGFDTDRSGIVQFATTTTDANGKKTSQYSDVKGRVSAIKNLLGENPVWTSFAFNALGEQIASTDDMGASTLSQYDMLGRRISRTHPDAGTTVYSYDLAGNLTQLQTANLSKEGGVISYSYEYERLREITYPHNPENNVRYSYGKMGDPYNRAGRVSLQEDATGAQEFFYGPLGEVVKNIRTVVIPGHDEQSYTTEWEYDTWNRLISMTYPDEEKVSYTYNAGGLLHSMKGEKAQRPYLYVKRLGYDKFEQRVFLAYGNGTKTTYSYEEDRRRLSVMEAKTARGRQMMDNEYAYDKVNNILSLKNTAPVPTSNLMGGSSEYSYSYDDLYRLTKAEGSFTGSNEAHRYSLSMSYNTVGSIIEKNQLHERKGSSNEYAWGKQKKTSYTQSYSYSKEQPHAAIHIGEQSYSYDANGNSRGFTHDVSGQRRNILWDEENHIRTIMDNGAAYHYIYDASGERVLKGHSSGQSIFINADQKGGSGGMGNYTVYVNPYLVLKSGGYTKHYYIEGQRIVSKLGSGMDLYNKGRKAGGDKVDYPGKSRKIQEGIVKNLKFLGVDGAILSAGKSGKIPPGQLNGNGLGNSTAETFQYFYHPDHLGSTSYVTDASGEVYQHLEYFAFGETFVEEHSNTNRTPFLYNGKELDEETGLYYYGARYYDPRTSVFIAIDPHAENYPGWTPYNYCANNPVNIIDPDGRDWFSYKAEGEENTSWHWHDGSTYNTGEKDDNGNNIILQGVQAVVVFNGSRDEQLGQDNNLYGKGAKLAEVMVLGPNGEDDVQFYEGYTMSSDPEKYGRVADGTYNGNYDEVGKSGSLTSNWAINGRGRVAAQDNVNPNMPNQVDSEGNAYLTGVFIHRSNKNGYAGSPVSKGCLLIAPGRSGAEEDWTRFNNQMSGVQNFKVEINRSIQERKPRFK